MATASGAAPSDIDITASSADLTFDPSYLLNLEDSPVHPDSHFQVRAYRRSP